MGREEAVSAPMLQDVEAVTDHELVVQRSDASDCVLDQVGELVAETEGQECSCKDYQSAFPSELPYQQGYYGGIHRSPYQLVGEELPHWVCYK